MKTVEFSVMFHNQRAVDLLQNLLADFEKQSRIKVNLKILNWNEAWAELVKVALYRSGPDLSEIGNTWVSDFARMAALASFSATEIKAIGGQEKFLPSLWQSSQVYGAPEIWAIPWLADTRMLFYRRDMLKSAGVKEEGAFESYAALDKALTQLKKKGHEIPWVIPTQHTNMTIHHIASWVWGAGGHFLRPDGKESLLDSPEAMEGLIQYFSLIKHLAPPARDQDDTGSDSLYWTGKAVATLSGPWLMVEDNVDVDATVRQNTGFVSPPGVPYLGGSHLTIWKHSRQKSEAIGLINYLNSPKIQLAYSKEIGLLPANIEALSSSEFSRDPQHKKLVKRVMQGRSFRSTSLWGMVENRVSGLFNAIWEELKQNPEADIQAVIEAKVPDFTQRLNTTLKQA